MANVASFLLLAEANSMRNSNVKSQVSCRRVKKTMAAGLQANG